MTICPVALAVGCTKCPAVRICPLKSVLGDYRPPTPGETREESTAAHGSKAQRPRKPAAAKKKSAAKPAAGESGRSGRRKQP